MVWILGDNLLNDAAGHYQKYKPKPGDGWDNVSLYLEKAYAVKRITPGSYYCDSSKPFNSPALILHSYISALNEPLNAKIPDVIVILWNDYRFWNSADLLKKQMTKVIHKFIKELKKITEIRNYDLPQKAANWDNPRIFINKPLPLPNNMTTKYPPSFKSNRRRFCKLLHKGSVKDGYTLLSFEEFTSDNANKFFHQNGTIAEEGYNHIWSVVSDTIHKNDKHLAKIARKVKAKELATIPEAQSTDCDESDMDGIWNADSENSTPTTKQSPARRSLLSDFDKATDKRPQSCKNNLPATDVQSNRPSHIPTTTRGGFNQRKPKRGRGQGFGFFPQGFIPFNPYFGYGFNGYNKNKRGRFNHF